MPDPTKPLLLDFFHLAWVMLAFGLVAYALIRRTNPLIRWHEHGNVWTAPFQGVDVVFLFAFLGLYYWGTYTMVHSEKPPPDLNEIKMVPLLLAQIVTMGSLMIGILCLLGLARRIDLMELFGLKRLSIAQVILWTIGILVVTLPVLGLVSYGWNSWLLYTFGAEAPQQELVTKLRETDALGLKLLMAFTACVVAPLTEEVIFRGYLYPTLKRFTERLFAAIVLSLFFAVVHGNTASILPLFFFAMALTIAYEVTGCLLVPIAMHAIFNTMTVVIIFIQPANA